MLAMAAAVYPPIPGNARSSATVFGIDPCAVEATTFAALCSMRALR